MRNPLIWHVKTICDIFLLRFWIPIVLSVVVATDRTWITTKRIESFKNNHFIFSRLIFYKESLNSGCLRSFQNERVRTGGRAL